MTPYVALLHCGAIAQNSPSIRPTLQNAAFYLSLRRFARNDRGGWFGLACGVLRGKKPYDAKVVTAVCAV